MWAVDPGPSRPHTLGRARIVAQRRRARGGGRRRRGGPWNVGEVEEVQQVRLRRIARSQVSRATDKPVLHKLDYRCVIHWRVCYVMASWQRGNEHALSDPPYL